MITLEELDFLHLNSQVVYWDVSTMAKRPVWTIQIEVKIIYN